ncbi:MAG: SPOR domain-containing protein [Pseudomonadota bacterium]
MAFPAMSGPGYESDRAETSLFSAIVNWIGAALSVTLVVGLVWWAYDIAVRDTRAVPVVRAMEGPARVAPEYPGGFTAPHKGYAVNAIAGEDSREPVAEEVALAPAPAAIAESDAPARRPGEAPAEEAIRSSVDRALMDALGLEASPEALPAAVMTDDGLRRPQPRPTAGAEVSRTRTSEPLPLVAATEAFGTRGPIAPLDIPPGTRLVQLGAFSSEAAAQQEWTNLASAFSEYFSDKRPVFEETDASGQSLWRLRAHGFTDRAEARRFCEVLLAGQVECIPVLTR